MAASGLRCLPPAEDTFADTAADMLCATTMNNVQEAAGIALAAQRAQLPVAISFTENFHSLQITPTASNTRGCTT